MTKEEAIKRFETLLLHIDTDCVMGTETTEAINMAIKALEQPERKRWKWIPCSERLPEVYDNYLITTHDGNVDIGTIDPKRQGVWSACDADGFYWLREVVAWMPLPTPYKEEQDERR